MSQMHSRIESEIFGRSKIGAATGMFGTVVMLVLQWDAHVRDIHIIWFVISMFIFFARTMFASQTLKYIGSNLNIENSVYIEIILCMFSGIAWSSSLYAFDTGAYDSKFYLRLIVLAVTSSFSTSLLTISLPIYFSFAFGLYIPAIIYFFTKPYTMEAFTIVSAIITYMGVTSVMAVANNRRFTESHLNHIKNMELSVKLGQLLASETRLREELAQLARIDELTGLANRRALLEKMESELSRCSDGTSRFAVIAIDIDHFKTINDTWGHAAGDAVLRSFGTILRESVFDPHFSGRTGGEEFVVGLSEMDPATAVAIANQIRTTTELKHVVWNENNISVTASFGVAVFQPGLTVKNLLSIADEALYTAKKSGRNRVVLKSEIFE